MPRSVRKRDHLGRPLPPGTPGLDDYDEPAPPPEPALRLAQQLLEAGRPFTAHEVLEAVWKAAASSERDLWRGLAQLAVAVTHAARGNPRGAAALRERAATSLSAWQGDHPYGVPIDELLDWCVTGTGAPPSLVGGQAAEPS